MARTSRYRDGDKNETVSYRKQIARRRSWSTAQKFWGKLGASKIFRDRSRKLKVWKFIIQTFDLLELHLATICLWSKWPMSETKRQRSHVSDLRVGSRISITPNIYKKNSTDFVQNVTQHKHMDCRFWTFNVTKLYDMNSISWKLNKQCRVYA